MKSNDQKPMFIVIYDDRDCLCIPMVWDDDCEGALCGGVAEGERVALFSSRAAARKAIDVSAKWAALNKAKGVPHNGDFLGKDRKNVRIVPCQMNTQTK